MAARYGTLEIVEYLLDRGVDVAATDGMTALHNATGRADIEMTRLLIDRGAPLEKKNSFGGTVLDSTLWFAYNLDPFDRAGKDYPAVIDILLAAGAKADLYPKMQGYIDEIYRRGGRERA
jgi:ankyrin repeat protein